MNAQERLQYIAALAYDGGLDRLSSERVVSLIRNLTREEAPRGSEENRKAVVVNARIAAQRGRPR